MNKYQKETIKLSLEEEKKVLNSLTSEYKEAKKAVKSKLKTLMERTDADLPHVIHQIKYQKAIESQIDEALEKLKSGEYKTIADYMEDSYGTGFTSSLYRLQKQGVPLLFPMDRNEIIRAVQTNSKISGGLYKRLGINTRAMKNAIRQEITRGISSSMSYGDIARNLDSRMNSGLYNSYRIARTEGHRINQEASYDAMNKAKKAGADIVKQWDSTLDGRTRPHHRDLNGQIRELDDPFEVAGLSAMYPSGFGKASEDINCRCVVLEIGRWELDEEDTFTKFDGDEGVIVKDFSNVKNYEEFRKKYNIEIKKKAETINNPVNVVNTESKVDKALNRVIGIQEQQFKTITEAQDYARNTLNIEADYSKFDVSLANKVNYELERINSVFGDVGNSGYLERVGKYPKRASFYACYSPSFKEVFFTKTKGKNILNKMTEEAMNAFNAGFWSTGNAEHSIRHEVGHAIDYWKRLSNGNSDKVTKIKGLYDKYKKLAGITKWENKGDYSEYAKAKPYLSYYGFYNEKEFVAESIAEFMTGNPRQVAKEVVEVLLE